MAKVKVETLVESVGSVIVYDMYGSVSETATQEAWHAFCDKVAEDKITLAANKIREENIESKLLFKDLLSAYQETTAKWDGMIGEAVFAVFELYAAAKTVPSTVPTLVGSVAETLRTSSKIGIMEVDEARKQVARWLKARNGTVVSYGPGKAGVKLLAR